ncbi:MAG: DNA topoisomerase VI subunit B [Candidatus Aenigmatarchaeota archaeon]
MAKGEQRSKTAEEMATEQRAISVAEFFEKNRHLLGFDNPAKALLTVVREAVDNSLDACEEARILPEIKVTIEEPREIYSITTPEGEGIGEFVIEGKKASLLIDGLSVPMESKEEKRNGNLYFFVDKQGKKYKVRETVTELERMVDVSSGKTVYKVSKAPAERFKVIVEDNGPGIVKEQIPNVFGRLLYGSKFYKLKQSRGQQGVGISAAVLYSQLTTGKTALITSRTGPNKPVHAFQIRIDVTKNMPEIIKEEVKKDGFQDSGVRIELEVEGKYMERYHSVHEYLKQTAAVNPFAHIIFNSPDGTRHDFKRAVNELPVQPKNIKPHPLGVEVGMLERMAKATKTRNITGFLTGDFCRIGPDTAIRVVKQAGLKANLNPKEMTHEQIDKLWRSIHATSFMNPPLDCLSPIGERKLEEGLKKEYKPEFIVAVSRPPAVYRGMPFKIEAAIAYGGEIPKDGPAKILRFANRVPLIYQASSCAISKAMNKVDWKHYGIEKQGNTLMGPIVVAVHMASVWIPYTSESKEAIDPYPDIVKEIRLALQDCGRRLQRFLSGRRRAAEAQKRMSLFERYIPEIAFALSNITGEKKEKIAKDFEAVLKKGKVQIEEKYEETEEKIKGETRGEGAEPEG